MTLDTAAIARIAEMVRAIDPEDDQLLADMIEAETDAFDVLKRLHDRRMTLAGHLAGIKEYKADLTARAARFKAQDEAIKRVMGKLVEATGRRSLEAPFATITLRNKGREIGVEGPVPSDARFVRTKVEADKVAIKKALLAGEDVPGWHLDNGGEIVEVRAK